MDWLSQIGPSDYALTPVQWCVLGKAGGAAAESRGESLSTQCPGERGMGLGQASESPPSEDEHHHETQYIQDSFRPRMVKREPARKAR